VIKAKDEVVLVGGDSGLIFKGGSITAYSSGTFIAKVSNKDISTQTPEPMSAAMENVSATSGSFNRGLSAYDQQILVSNNDSQQAKPIKKDVLADISHFEY
jgi:uncharacterized protein (DUF2345 family)